MLYDDYDACRVSNACDAMTFQLNYEFETYCLMIRGSLKCLCLCDLFSYINSLDVKKYNYLFYLFMLLNSYHNELCDSVPIYYDNHDVV